jgi:hypothetical protein
VAGGVLVGLISAAVFIRLAREVEGRLALHQSSEVSEVRGPKSEV